MALRRAEPGPGAAALRRDVEPPGRGLQRQCVPRRLARPCAARKDRARAALERSARAARRHRSAPDGPPAGVNRVSLALFFDVGAAWEHDTPPDYHRGVGAELISETRFGYLFGLQARAGVASASHRSARL